MHRNPLDKIWFDPVCRVIVGLITLIAFAPDRAAGSPASRERTDDAYAVGLGTSMLAKLRVVGIVAMAAGLLAGTPSSADSQTVPPTSPSVGDVVSVGRTVWVTTTDGRARKGVVFSVSASMLELLSDHRKVALAFGDVSTVEVEFRDSLTNGIRNGLLAGALSGVAVAIFVVASDCRQQTLAITFCSPDGFVRAAGMTGLMGAGIGAIAGWVVDASIHQRRVVYRARSVSVGVVPLIAARGAEVGVVARW